MAHVVASSPQDMCAMMPSGSIVRGIWLSLWRLRTFDELVKSLLQEWSRDKTSESLILKMSERVVHNPFPVDGS